MIKQGWLLTRAQSIVSLNGLNFPTWKIQCKMALMREGIWSIVDGSETSLDPDSAETRDSYLKFVSGRDKALATIVLSIDPSLLYLIGEPEDPIVVWRKLNNQFQKPT
jgi:hypothetical protein